MTEKFRRMSLGLPALRREFSDNSAAFIKPEDQLELTQQELNEDITNTLDAKDPEASNNLVEFSFQKKEYIPIQEKNLALYQFHHKSVLTALSDVEPEKDTLSSVELKSEKAGNNKDDVEIEQVSEDDNSTLQAGNDKKFFNSFNFCEQASQTPLILTKNQYLQTHPPPRYHVRRNVNKSNIYDAYMQDIAKKKMAKFSHQSAGSETTLSGLQKPSKPKREMDDFSTKIRDQLTNIERVVVQNTYDEVYQDFKYFEDPCDSYKDKEGSVLPLWEFTTNEKSKRMDVTDLCWNPHFPDVFAVTYGSNEFRSCKEPYELSGEEKGRLCIYTLQNPTFPKYNYEASQYIMCVDMHPDYPHLLCIGLYDGSVKVLSLQTKNLTPVSKSKRINAFHLTSATKVRWNRKSNNDSLSFLSVSTDGHIFSWELFGSELRGTEILSLAVQPPQVVSIGEPLIHLSACCSSLCFHKRDSQRVLVGTEEGHLFECRLGFTSQSRFFSAHYQTVTGIDWNHYSDEIFATCGEDGLVRIWSICIEQVEPNHKLLLEFDLHSPVLGVAWSPFTSTVLAAAALDGRLHVFDLAVDRSRPLCLQQLVDPRRCRLTRLSFNSSAPILIVGDSRGRVTALKLSPNLRLKPKLGKKADESQILQMEKDKLTKVLGYLQVEPE